MKYELTITHLYPENLNLYGDTGNMICLKRRCEWHDIDFKVKNINIGDELKIGETDIYFIGGGQDSDQVAIVEDFHKLKYETVKADIENDVVFLGVCGGYQLMGHNFLMGNGELTKGLGIIDIETKAPGTEVNQRCIGNLIAELNETDYEKIQTIYSHDSHPTPHIPKTLVGFENHSGQTYLAKNPSPKLGEGQGEVLQPLGKTLRGFGNNSTEGQEGARYKNVFGTYMHGSFLPKNPHIADYLIWLALTQKYKETIKLKNLDDHVEYAAHKKIVTLYK